ncbi:MAG: M81 family metallopeptidase [Actinobacteria bacterium]|nr:M81 family metallopeptidase [Actinomycetota bacterium]
MRVAIAEVQHESHGFHPRMTGLEQFRELYFSTGDDIIPRFAGTSTALGGYLDALGRAGVEIVPTVAAMANPAGPVTRMVYETIKGELLKRLAAGGPLDGMLLSLHGAMMVEGLPDGEGDLLRSIRELVGSRVPVLSILDLHANMTQAMVKHADVLIGYKTYPHTDMAERAEEVTNLFLRMKRGEVRPIMLMERPPMMPPSMNMRTDVGPMAELVQQARRLETRSGVLSASVFGGYPYCDFPEVGFAVLVVADQLAREEGVRAVGDLAHRAWDLRHQFLKDLTPVDDAIRQAMEAREGPIALTDVADNPFSGGFADTPLLLRRMLELRVTNAAFAIMCDPETVARAIEVGVGNVGPFSVGGKSDPRYGPPVELEGRVATLADGIFRNKGPMMHGLEMNFGRTAVIDTGGIGIVVTERCISPNDPEIFRRVGIDPSEKKILGLKVKNHFRAGFEPILKRIIEVDAPGIASLNLRVFPFKNVRRPVFPLDDEVEVYGGWQENG